MSNRIYWKLGDHELEVEGEAAFIQKQLSMFFEKIGATKESGTKPLPSKVASTTPSGKVLSPAEYLRQKSPDGGTETLIVLGKYLEEFRSKSDFSKKDIDAIAGEAKLKGIHSQYFTYAVKQGTLRALGRGQYGLSMSGEDAVAAMPSKKAQN